MSSQSLGTASVDIVGDLRGLDEDITRGIRSAFADVERVANSAFEGVESDAREAGRTIEREVGGGADRARGGFGGLGRTVGLIGGALAAAGIGSVLSSATSEAERANSALANTEQIIEATGGAAGITSGQVQALAEDFQFRLGIDDTEVQEAANVLLTFRNVGEETFERTLGLSADLSNVLGTDLAGANLQLGKALNDPVTGITALNRAGVTFTEQQKEQIRTLQESGDLVGAQTLILDELEQQVGGTAEASADSTARIAAGFGEVRESLGSGLIGAIDAAAPALLGVFESLEGPLATVGDSLGQALVPLLDVLGPALVDLSGLFVSIIDTLGVLLEAFAPLLPVITNLAAVLGEAFLGALQTIILAVAPVLVPFLETVAGILVVLIGLLEPFLPIILAIVAAVRLWGAVQAVLNAALLANPIGLVVAALAALVAGVVYAYRNSERFRAIVAAVWDGLKAAWAWIASTGLAVWNRLREAIAAGGRRFAQFRETVAQVFERVRATISSALSAIAKFITGAIRGYIALWQGAWNAVRVATSAAFRAIQSTISSVLNAIGSLLSRVVRGWQRIIETAWGAIRSAVSSALSAIRSAVSSGLSAVSSVFSSVWNGLRSTVSRAWTSVRTAVTTGISSVLSLVRSLPGRIISAVGNLGSLLYNAGRDVVEGLGRGLSSMKDYLVDRARDLLGPLGRLLPGSPVREGPLTVLNDGYAGGEIVRMLADGMLDERRELQRTSERIAAAARPPLDAPFAAPAVALAPGARVGTRTPLPVRGASAADGAGAARQVVQHFYGPRTGREILRETEWALRYAT